MEQDFSRLGEHVIKAARLAVAMHLFGSLSENQHQGQRVVIGGAGPAWSNGHDDGITEDALPATEADAARSSPQAAGAPVTHVARAPSRIARDTPIHDGDAR